MQTYNGKIQFGDRIREIWYGFDDFNHEKVQANIAEVISKPHLFKGFDLYIMGGILEGWLTWDIDWFLVGPYMPDKIKEVFNWIEEVGFKHGIYPDNTYSKKLVSLNHWQNTRKFEAGWHYKNSNLFIKEGKRANMSNYEKTDNGLYKRWTDAPFAKNIKMDKKGHKYKKPIKII